MPRINIARQRVGMPTIARSAVKPGQVFTLANRDGTLNGKQYLHLGNNGKLFSINLATGELASTGNGQSKVVILGKGSLKVTYTAEHGHTTRRLVRSNQVFRAAGGGRENAYAALGKLSNGKFASLNLNNPFDDDYATTSNGDRKVVILGTYEVDAVVAA